MQQSGTGLDAMRRPRLRGMVLISVGFVIAFTGFGLQFRQAAAAPYDVSSAVDGLIPIEGVRDIVAGIGHTCILTMDGGVKCWGDNSYGQLGDGTRQNRRSPVSVIGLSRDVVSLSAGRDHTCALKSMGIIACWGKNADGQLGDNTWQDQTEPTDVVGFEGVPTSVSAGGEHTCALSSSGIVKCWGQNGDGQLGDSTWQDHNTAVAVVGLADRVEAIDSGGEHTCALTSRGLVKCWGSNNVGQLGDGTWQGQNIPVDVIGLEGIVTGVHAGDSHTCAVFLEGIACWGWNFDGQIGDGSRTDRNLPVNVLNMGGVIAVALGRYHSCALTDGRDLYCWGRNAYGQLGDGTTDRRSTPGIVLGLEQVIVAISAGRNHSCAVTAGSGAKCWGSNLQGQLSDGTSSYRSTPEEVANLASNVNTISAGGTHSCASVQGTVVCWGENTHGQLGTGGWADGPGTPQVVLGLDNGAWVPATGMFFSCAIVDTGSIECWGDNTFGQLGNGTTTGQRTPTSVVGLTGETLSMTTGDSHACALLIDGTIQCWGNNVAGQLGNGTNDDSAIPTSVLGLGSQAIMVDAGGSHTCVLTVVGGVKCWGDNSFGQLGDGTTIDRSFPVDVVGLRSDVFALSAGYGHTCVVTVSADVQCWGSNFFGQLGDGSASDRYVPIDVSGLGTQVTGVTAGDFHTCAQMGADEVRCWGWNSFGQLGNGTTTDSSVPVKVVELNTEIALLDAGSVHNCVVTNDGAAKCWGSNKYGQLGDETGWRTYPTDVLTLPSSSLSFLPIMTRSEPATPSNRVPVLNNGGFEIISGPNIAWSQMIQPSDSESSLIVSSNEVADWAARSGIGLAWLGGFEDGEVTSWIEQTFVVDSGLSGRVLLQFWYAVGSEERDCVGNPSDDRGDIAEVWIDSRRIWHEPLCQETVIEWTRQSIILPLPNSGGEVSLRFRTQLDRSESSSFYLDDVVICTNDDNIIGLKCNSNTSYAEPVFNPNRVHLLKKPSVGSRR